LRPNSAAAAGSCTKVRVTGSLHTDIPGATVAALLPANLTGWLLPGTSAAAVGCRPTWMPSKVTGLGPERVGKPEPHLSSP
jgi:hypothetical protein